jgi:hypothetical protein
LVVDDELRADLRKRVPTERDSDRRGDGRENVKFAKTGMRGPDSFEGLHICNYESAEIISRVDSSSSDWRRVASSLVTSCR